MAEIKISDWLCIAQEGKTIDGREVKRDWLTSIAENYSPDLYQAMIWCEHEDPVWRQFSANLGTVEELKLEEKDGKLRLMARLRANTILQSMNEQEQKIYSSVEILPDFPDEGSYYLVGLAATDQPASTGLSRLAFSKNGQDTAKGFRAAPVLFLGSGKTVTPKRNIDFSKFTKRENFSMTQDEIDALLAELEAAKQLNIDLQAQIDELKAQLESGDTKAAQETVDDIQEQVEQTEESLENATEQVEEVDPEEFSKLKNQIIELKKQNQVLTNRFNAIVNTPVNKKPGISSRSVGIELH